MKKGRGVGKLSARDRVLMYDVAAEHLILKFTHAIYHIWFEMYRQPCLQSYTYAF